MARRDIEAGRAFVRVSMNDTAFVRGIRRAQQRLHAFGRAGIATGAAFTGAGAAILAPLGIMAQQFAAAGDAAGKMAARTGVSAEAIQELGFAAEQSGSSAQAVEKALAGMARTIYDAGRGSAEANEGLARLGLTLGDLEGLTPDEQLERFADGLANVEDASTRTALAQKLLGRSGRELIPLLSGGADSIRALRAEARALNIPLTGDEVRAAEALTDAMNRLKRSISTAKNLIGSALAEPLTIVSTTMAQVAAIAGRWIRENRQLFAGLAAGGVALVAIGGAIGAVGVAATIGSIALGGLLTLFGAFSTVVAAVVSPLGLVITALAAGAIAWAKWTAGGRSFVEFAKRSFVGVLDIVRDTLGGVYDALAGGDLELAGKIAFTGLKLVFAEGINAIANLIGGAEGDGIRAAFKQLMTGDMQGAMTTALQTMETVFIRWGANIVSVMAKVAKEVLAEWRKLSEEIANSIVESASSSQKAGAAFLPLLGIDLHAEAVRGEAYDRELRTLAVKRGDKMPGQDTTSEDYVATLYDEIQSNLAEGLEKLADAAQQAADDAADELGRNAREIGEIDTSDLAAQLEALRAEAAAARAASKIGATPDKAAADLAAELADSKQTTFGATSSAAVAALAATSTGPQQRLLTAAEKQVRQLADIVTNGEATIAALKTLGVRFE